MKYKKLKYNCIQCDFICNNKKDYNKHLLTKKHYHNGNPDIDNGDNIFNFKCHCGKEYSNRGTLYRHRIKCVTQQISIPNNYKVQIYICLCGKEYKHLSSYSRHRKICCFLKETCDNNLDLADVKSYNPEMILMLIKQNEDFQKVMKDQQEQYHTDINNIIPLIGPITNNITNNKFNLNIFLNEKCKEAINFSEFVNDLYITDEDLDFSRSNGFVNGLCNIFMRGLKKLTKTTRPLHCTDSKRDIIYIKENNKWDKDINNEKLINTFDNLSNKQYDYIKNTWFHKNQNNIMEDDNLKVKHCHYIVAVAHSAGDNKHRQCLINNVEKIVGINK
jgi:hypothetical protein